MKNYIIFHTTLGFRGFTASKEIMKAFRRQRDMEKYTVHKVKDDELHRYGINELSDDDEIFLYKNFAVCRDEEEMFTLSMDQYAKDFRMYISHVLYYSQFIKMEDWEIDCLYQFGRIIKEVLDFLDSDESPEDFYEKIFDLPQMFDSIT